MDQRKVKISRPYHKLTPDKMAKIDILNAKEWSPRAIGVNLSVHHQTVVNYLNKQKRNRTIELKIELVSTLARTIGSLKEKKDESEIKPEPSNQLLSTPVCDLKIPSEASSVRSSRRKQPHLEIGTPFGRQTPRKVNAGIASDTPNKLVMTATQQKEAEDNTIDIENTSEMPQIPPIKKIHVLSNVMLFNAGPMTNVKCVSTQLDISTATDSLSANDTTIESESFTFNRLLEAKQKSHEIVSTTDGSQSDENSDIVDSNHMIEEEDMSVSQSNDCTNMYTIYPVQLPSACDIEEAQEGSEVVAEQNENVESHTDTHDDIPAIQIRSHDSITPTPVFDDSLTPAKIAVDAERETAVTFSVCRSQSVLESQTDDSECTSKEMNVSWLKDTQIECTESIMSTLVCDSKLSCEQATSHKPVTNVPARDEHYTSPSSSNINHAPPSKPQMSSSQLKKSEENVTDSKNEDLEQKTTKNKSADRNLAIARSLKRKQPEYDIEMPVARRTPTKTSEICEVTVTNQIELKISRDLSLKSQQYLCEADEMETWINGKMYDLKFNISGRDRDSTIKYIELELDIYSGIISEMGHTAASMVALNHQDSKLIAAKQQLIEKMNKSLQCLFEDTTSQNAAKMLSSDHCDSTESTESNSPKQNTEAKISGNKAENSNDDVTIKTGKSLRAITTEKDDTQKCTAPVVKTSRRKRANTLTEKLTNGNNKITPIPMKSHLDHIAIEAKEIPGSSRSLLRARAIAVTIDETSTVTPKRSRKPKPERATKHTGKAKPTGIQTDTEQVESEAALVPVEPTFSTRRTRFLVRSL